jgi:ABC-type antimicrobial peptide transport system permease subunit
MVLVARTSVDPASTAGALRQQVWAIDKDQPVFEVKTMEDVRSVSVALYSFSSVTLGIFAGVALLLASIGIYGVMAYIVAQRTNEIGVRVALGAQAMDVMKMVLLNGAKLTLLGVVIGLAASFGLTRLLTSLLFGVSPIDARVFVSIPILLSFVALLASYFPARRAAKVDPIVALRDG